MHNKRADSNDINGANTFGSGENILEAAAIDDVIVESFFIGRA